MITDLQYRKIFLMVSDEKKTFLIQPFLNRVNVWINKSDSSDDAFDTYISIFIAYNMFYNLWDKVKYPNKNERYSRDANKSIEVLDLIDFNNPPDIKPLVRELINILNRHSLLVEIFEKKNNKPMILLAQDVLQRQYEKDEDYFEYLIKVRYKIRCNLVHGEKGYESRQIELLNQSSKILKEVLLQLTNRLNDLLKKN